jgi:hypothetical protein
MGARKSLVPHYRGTAHVSDDDQLAACLPYQRKKMINLLLQTSFNLKKR